MRRIFYFLPAVMLLTSCNKDSKQDWSGMEYYTFEVTGKVTDGSGSPIVGINVEISGERTTTLSDGTYRLKGDGSGIPAPVCVSFSDFDGEENGGKYMHATKTISLTYVTGAHGPYMGLFSMSNVDVMLTLITQLTPPSTDQPVPLP